MHGIMARRKNLFPPYEVSLVEAGERAGMLAQSLEQLSVWYAFRDRLRGIILAGLTMPLIVFHLTVLLSPAPMLFLGRIGIMGYLFRVAGTLAFLYLPAAAILALIHYAPREDPLRRRVDLMALKIPALGRGILHLSLGRFCKAFNALYRYGNVPMEKCVSLAVEISGNSVVKGWLEGSIESSRAGDRISKGFSSELPHEFIEVWRTGEETGTLEDACERLARVYEGVTERAFISFARWFPRIVYAIVCMIIIVSIFRGFFAIMAAQGLSG